MREGGRVGAFRAISRARARIARVLWNDPATGVMRHADAGYDTAIDCAKQHGLRLPGILNHDGNT